MADNKNDIMPESQPWLQRRFKMVSVTQEQMDLAINVFGVQPHIARTSPYTALGLVGLHVSSAHRVFCLGGGSCVVSEYQCASGLPKEQLEHLVWTVRATYFDAIFARDPNF